MRRSLAVLLVLLLLSILVVPLCAQAPEPAPAPDFSELERTALDEMSATSTPGAAVAVIQGERVVFTRGFGVASLETNEPVTPDTLFRIGSVTKMLTAAAVLTLVRQERLNLDDPLSKKDKRLDPKLGRLTLDQLLSQTSGLRDFPAGDGRDHGDEALDHFVEWLGTQDSTLVPPGTAFSYSNSNYAVAGSLLTRATGKHYADAMDEILFKPLGMTRTTLRPTVAMTYPLAVGHAVVERVGLTVVRPLADDSRLWPAGYAFSSVNDLSRFIRAVLNGGMLEGRQALRSGVTEILLNPHVPIPTNVFRNGAYGYGFFLQDDRGLRRAEDVGELPGYGAEVRMFPERRVAVIVLTNHQGRLQKTFDKAFDLVLGPKPKEEAPPRPEVIRMTDEEMASYAGTYVNRESLELFVNKGNLFLSRGDSTSVVNKIGENRFRVRLRGLPQPQEFLIVPEAEGRPAYLQMVLWVYRKE
jgi:CubicO group peptidase (beta-lactamase class C family)